MAYSRTAPKPRSRADFIEAAHRTVETDASAGASQAASDTAPLAAQPQGSQRQTPGPADETAARPWLAYSRDATPKNLFNLRLTDYHLAMLRHLAQLDEDASMQKIIKKILLPELERRAKQNP